MDCELLYDEQRAGRGHVEGVVDFHPDQSFGAQLAKLVQTLVRGNNLCMHGKCFRIALKKSQLARMLFESWRRAV